MEELKQWYESTMAKADPRVKDWPLMETPFPIIATFFLYMGAVFLGPRLMRHRTAWSLKYPIILYNCVLVYWSLYMFYEFLVTSYLSNYSYICEPVDYSNDSLAMRMASVCWWFFFSKVIELLDTVFFILRKKDNQVTFLHVYHHCTMIFNWYLGARFTPGGQAFFLAMLNSFVHIWMYSYYALAALGPHMQKYLWWKRYLTVMQLTQFALVIAHTSVNLYVQHTTGCDFPPALNYAVFSYAISLVILFSNFFRQTYVVKKNKTKMEAANGEQNGKQNGQVQHQNGSSVRSRQVNKE